MAEVGLRAVPGTMPVDSELGGALLPYVDGAPLTLHLAACPHRYVLVFRNKELLIEAVAQLVARHVSTGRAPSISTEVKQVTVGRTFVAECRAQRTRIAMDLRIVGHDPGTDRFDFRFREVVLDGEPVNAAGCLCCVAEAERS